MSTSANYVEEPEPSIHVGNVETRRLLFRCRVLFKWRRIIDEERLSLNILHRHKSPESAILAEIPIVAHDEKMVLWDLDRTVSCLFGRSMRLSKKCACGFSTGDVIDEHLLLANLDSIASDRNHTLYEVFAPVFRPNKYDDISRLRILEMRPTSVRKRNANVRK